LPDAACGSGHENDPLTRALRRCFPHSGPPPHDAQAGLGGRVPGRPATETTLSGDRRDDALLVGTRSRLVAGAPA
jgi:hypothetical protein